MRDKLFSRLLGLEDVAMIRRLALFFGVLAIIWAPTMVCAQYSGAFGLSGLPSMPSMFGSSGKCGDAGAPNLSPAVYIGWGIPQDRNTSVTLSAQNTGLVPSLNTTLRTVNVNLPTNGVWLGAALPMALTSPAECGSSSNLSFVASGWYLFTGQTNPSLYDDYIVNVPPPFSTHTWNSQGAWWFVDGALAYGWTGFAALLGLRYDNYSLNLTSPDNLNGGLFTGQQEGQFLSSAWIPFIGFQSAYTDTVQSLKVRMLGIPTILGYSYLGVTVAGADRLQYNNVNYSGGYFFEAFGEYSRKFLGSSQAGVFLRWNATGARSSDTAALVNAASSDKFDFSLTRNSWTLGGLVTLDFNSPI